MSEQDDGTDPVKIEIKCNHIDGVGRRLGYSLSDAGFENVNDEELNRRIDELRDEIDMRTLKDGEVVDIVILERSQGSGTDRPDGDLVTDGGERLRDGVNHE